MTEALTAAATAINAQFARERPGIFARRLEKFQPEIGAGILDAMDLDQITSVWERISADIGNEILPYLSEKTVKHLLESLSPTAAVNMLSRLTDEERGRRLALLPSGARKEVTSLLDYPEGTAGRNMDLDFFALRPSDTVEGALSRLRRGGVQRVIYAVDDDLRLLGRISLQKLALSEPDTTLEDLVEPVLVSVSAVEPMEAVVEAFAEDMVVHVPVVDLDGRLIGYFQEGQMTEAAKRDATADLQTMVGVSANERALSPVGFAFRKRMGWLQVNLLTAFMAAAVVGIFEDTIAKVTALAVLLPVVAGQSGNAGAQALAVTMRGLALREITLRHWLKVTWKEARVGFLNGVAIAVTCGIGVYVWSGSLGLVAVICSSMVLAMVAAGLAGALVPILLSRFGQDPATASSIILTTVTDIAGFFAFLGIASLLMATL